MIDVRRIRVEEAATLRELVTEDAHHPERQPWESLGFKADVIRFSLYAKALTGGGGAVLAGG
jgi:hypothetical protein